MQSHLLDPLLNPRSVAVVGASSDPRKRGFQAVRALQTSGYQGRIYPVHPRGGTLLDLPVVDSIDRLPPGVDLALVCTPADTAASVVRECGEAGIAGAVLLAVGFRESGAEGLARERAVLEASRETGIRLVGPNTSGLLNLGIGLNLIGARDVRAGSLGLLVQSGNLALNLMLDASRRSSEGVSICVGVGNEIDLGFADFLGFLSSHDDTRAILVHAEGFRRGHDMLAAAAAASRRKPVVVLKAGRTEAGARAARSHTGAVSGQDAVLRAAFRQAGVIQVDRSDELFHVGETLAHQPVPPSTTGVAILTDGGGQGTLAIDRLVGDGVRRSTLAAPTREALRTLLGPAAAVDNPIDLAGAADGDPERFADVLDIILSDPGVGCVLVVGLFGGYALRFDRGLLEAEVAAAERMARAAAEAKRGLVVHTMFAPEKTRSLEALRAAHVPVIDSLEVACRCVGALLERGDTLASDPWQPSPEPRKAIGAAIALPEPEARKLLENAGLPLVPAHFAGDVDTAVTAADRLGGAVVLKIVADGIEHKTEAGGVRLNLRGEESVRQAWADIMASADQWRETSGARVSTRGVLVSPMLPPPIAELLIGTHRDPQVGPVVTVGAGGTWVEVLNDVATRACPISSGEAASMLEQLRISPILSGLRGGPPADVPAIVRCIEAMSRLLVNQPEVVEAEINPLFALPHGAVAVDARVYASASGTERPGARP